ncbi:MAG: ferrochelatase [Chloroflexi bacterium]|nr:ferrochelatase [Chloroflexota bacterium]
MEPFAVFLTSFGSPEQLDEIPEFLRNIRQGRPTPEKLVREVQERYARIGGASPLPALVGLQARALQARLQTRAPESRVYVGMLYWKPYIHDVARIIHQDGYRRWVVIPLAPQYSRVSVGTYLAAVDRAVADLESKPIVHKVERWGDHPDFIAAVASHVQEALARFPNPEDVVTVFTAHSIPMHFVKEGDPYPQEVEESARRVAETVGLARWRVAYQSAGAQAVPWLGPDITDVFTELAQQGVKHVLVVPIGFLTDHVEVLYDLDIELKAHADQLGLHMERSASLNDDPRLIAALEDLVWRALAAEE